MDRGEGTTREGGAGEAAMDTREGATGDLRDHMIVHLQTRIKDLEVEVAARDVQLFSRESELAVVLRERDSAVERLAELQERVQVGVGAQGPTREVMREMRQAQVEIDYWQGLYE